MDNKLQDVSRADNTVVIAGAGHGGVQTAMSLRQGGFTGRIVLVCDEGGLPYQRPPLSKAYLQGKLSLNGLLLRPERFYSDNKIELRSAARLDAIDASSQLVQFSTGEKLHYSHLVLALGARNRTLSLEGDDLDGVQYIRTLADTDALKARLAAAEHIVVIGAGFIGLEFAAVASAQGKKVLVLERAPRVMARAVSEPVSAYFRQWHENVGTTFIFGAQATRIIGLSGRVTAVQTAEGQTLPADLVIVSVGIVPNTEVAVAAGLKVGDGILVDETLSTSDPSISAIGDCASFLDATYGQLRLECVQNANDQAKAVAERITGRSHAYNAVPWFWSDQGDQKLQMVGIGSGHSRRVIRGSTESRAFSVFCYAGDRLLAIESVNRPADHVFGRKALAMNRAPTPEQAADPSFDLKTLLA